MGSAIKTVFIQIDNSIKNGRFSEALDALKKISIKKLSRPERTEYCSYLRRAGRSREALKILFSTIYPRSRSVEQANESEKIEYASNLVRLGILSEAEGILKSIQVEDNPIVLIRLGFLAISEWNYQKSNELFLRYINLKESDAYNKLIAQVNLLQGYVNLEELNAALDLFKEIISEKKNNNYKLLLAATYEFGAEIFRQRKEFSKGYELIDIAKSLVHSQESLDYFLLEKQEWLLKSDEQFDSVAKKNYIDLKNRAVKLRHYESMRDLDFNFALRKKNVIALSEIYWKSSSIFYKEKLLKACTKNNLQIDTQKFSNSKNSGIQFDLGSRCFLNAEIDLKPTHAIARALTYLMSERYKPIKTIDIFNAVYPNEIYIPEYSESKTYQLIKRLKSFLQKNRLPLELTSKDEQYFLKYNGAFTLIKSENKTSSAFLKIRKKFNQQTFQTKDLMALFDCSWRTAMRIISQLKKTNNIVVIGKTKNASYKIAN